MENDGAGAQIEAGTQTRVHALDGDTTPVNYIKKAQNPSVDSNRAFTDNQYHHFTTLQNELILHGIEKLVVTGPVRSACFRVTAINGVKLGCEVFLIADATEASSAATKQTTIYGLING